MRINQLTIKNYRGFEGEHELILSDSPTAIVGVNGAGKTSLLDAVAFIFCKLLANSDDDLNSLGFSLDLNDISNNHFYSYLNGHINSTQNLYSKQLDIRMSRSENIRTFYKPILDIKKDINTNLVYTQQSIPVIGYYQSNRFFTNSNLNKTQVKHSFDRKDVYHNAFNASIDYYSMLSWYLLQKNIENNEKINKKDFDYESPILSTITDALNQFFSKLDDNKLTKLELTNSPNKTRQMLALHKGDKKLEFTQLSAGEKMVAGMVLDIAYRMGLANPHLENPLMSDGIVLIDELELHLHPKWQMTVLQALNATFPNIQFIVTTHSPLVINNLTNDQLVILDDFKIVSGKEVRNTYGKDVNSIVEDFMGASDRPKDIKTKLNEIETLLDEEQPNIELAKQKLANLKSIIDPNDYDILKLETLITIEEDEADY